jgi:uncharacterized protein (TIGR03000 family)
MAMRRNARVVGVVLLVVAVVLVVPTPIFAGGGGGGGRGGSGGGGARSGGSWNGGGWNGGSWKGGNWNRGAFYGGFGGWGWGFPIGGFYGGYGGWGPGFDNAYFFDVRQPTNLIVTPFVGDNITSAAPEAPAARPKPAEDRAYFTIHLPVSRAEVSIEGEKSVQDKATQDYVSPQLTPGNKYYYEVIVRWIANGKQYEAKQSFPVYPGKPVLVDFTGPEKPPSDN